MRLRRWVFLPAIPATFAVVLAMTLLAPSAYEWLHEDQESISRLIRAIEPRKEMFQRLNRSGRMREKTKGATDVTIIGDSHAIDGSWALKNNLGTSLNVVIIHSVCDPLVNSLDEAQLKELYAHHANRNATASRCAPHHQSLLQTIVSKQPELVVFSERWRPEVLPYLTETLIQIREATQAKIVVLGRNQEFRERPGKLLQGTTSTARINAVAWEHRVDHTELNEQLKQISERAGTVFIDKASLVCPVPGSCDYYASGTLTYFDRSHWSEFGLEFFGQRLIKKMVELQILKIGAQFPGDR